MQCPRLSPVQVDLYVIIFSTKDVMRIRNMLNGNLGLGLGGFSISGGARTENEAEAFERTGTA